MCKNHQITYEERMLIERHIKQKHSVKVIASSLMLSERAIYYELKRGRVELISSDLIPYISYSADIAQRLTDFNKQSHSSGLKIGNRHKLVKQIEHLIIKENRSPFHVCCELQLDFSVQTLYRYIHNGVFENLSSKNLRVKHKRNYDKVKAAPRYGRSIYYRPEHINNRSLPFHWEMDCVIGQKANKKALLVLTERRTRAELIFPLKRKDSHHVVKVLDKLFDKPYAKEIFQSITCDNGCEFSDAFGIAYDKDGEKRTELYYCHPYTSCERGSNENANRLIRYFFPKGKSLNDITDDDIINCADYINTLHRKILNGSTSKERFNSISPAPIESFYFL